MINYFLFNTALFFFIILCILAIAVCIVFLISILQVKQKTEDVLDEARDTVRIVRDSAFNITDMGAGVMDILSLFSSRRRKKKGLMGILFGE